MRSPKGRQGAKRQSQKIEGIRQRYRPTVCGVRTEARSQRLHREGAGEAYSGEPRRRGHWTRDKRYDGTDRG